MTDRLERRIECVRGALDDLSRAVDENLRTVLLLMTTEESVAPSLTLTETDDLERAVMDRCTEFLGLEGPVASDLHWATAAIRVGKDYERIAYLTDALFRRVQGLSGTLLDSVLHAMTALMRELLALHARIQRLWREPESELTGLDTDLAGHRGAIRAHLQHVEDLGVQALIQGRAGAENLRELVLATRHLKRISDELGGIPGELRRR